MGRMCGYREDELHVILSASNALKIKWEE